MTMCGVLAIRAAHSDKCITAMFDLYIRWNEFGEYDAVIASYKASIFNRSVPFSTDKLIKPVIQACHRTQNLEFAEQVMRQFILCNLDQSQAIQMCFQIMIDFDILQTQHCLDVLKDQIIAGITKTHCIEFIESAKTLRIAHLITNQVLFHLINPAYFWHFDSQTGHRVSNKLIALGGPIKFARMILDERKEAMLIDRYTRFNENRNALLTILSFQCSVLETNTVLRKDGLMAVVLDACVQMRDAAFAVKVWNYFTSIKPRNCFERYDLMSSNDFASLLGLCRASYNVYT